MGRFRVKNLEKPRVPIGKIEGFTEKKLVAVPVPEKTDTYTPVAHENVIGVIQREIKARKMEIFKTDYKTGFNGKQVIGFYQIVPEGEVEKNLVGDPDRLIRVVAFRNSYDKSMTFGVGAGAHVFICSNGVFSADMSFVKKHRGNLDEVVEEQIVIMFDSLEAEFERLLKFRRNLKEIELSKRVQAEILGRLIFEERILTATQIQIVKENRDYSEHFGDDVAWHLYNNITESLKKSNPTTFYNRHQQTTEFFQREIIGSKLQKQIS